MLRIWSMSDVLTNQSIPRAVQHLHVELPFALQGDGAHRRVAASAIASGRCNNERYR